MKFCYGAVFRGTTPLVVYSPEPGNFEKIFIDQYNKTNFAVGKTYLKVDNCLWVIAHDEQDLNILLVLQDTTDRETAEQFTDEIKSRFIRSHGNEWRTAQVHELYTRFEPQFRIIRQMIESSTTDKARQGEVFPPSSISERLTDYQYSFARDSSTIQKKAKKKAFALKCVALIILLCILIYLFLAVLCGSYNLKPKCRANK
ncbi:hypothetical protein TVAG_454340 [Trichomonas vaginalis G3]|uniref:Longin domain-containing protein n=1 Tax=Trichomonas vaginalis (strain ATCC PRA-98 / G3) TaxID=412133 RepID=A2EU47_TRIV3|nr:SNAP receptor protein [Trichomonas vaginalis G3]EAY03795.1 hypothetical protein TVAG_454340 [Trichomonas vaginalis G3]KAI5552624.1 SNAP receptor protein [Trichomonas vaginalis G3]|eukprot:XP_001316018.1 hypothetical protein [Trichomonas vaginalis G3]